jgi:hypothetical protein
MNALIEKKRYIYIYKLFLPNKKFNSLSNHNSIKTKLFDFNLHQLIFC